MAPLRRSWHAVVESDVEDVSSEALPLAHVITAELFLPRDFSTGLLVHVAQEPALVNVLKVLNSISLLHLLTTKSPACLTSSKDCVCLYALQAAQVGYGPWRPTHRTLCLGWNILLSNPFSDDHA